MKKRTLSQIRIDEGNDYSKFTETQPDTHVLGFVFHEECNSVTSTVAVALENRCYLVAEVLHLWNEIYLFQAYSRSIFFNIFSSREKFSDCRPTCTQKKINICIVNNIVWAASARQIYSVAVSFCIYRDCNTQLLLNLPLEMTTLDPRRWNMAWWDDAPRAVEIHRRHCDFFSRDLLSSTIVSHIVLPLWNK